MICTHVTIIVRQMITVPSNNMETLKFKTYNPWLHFSLPEVSENKDVEFNRVKRSCSSL